MIMKHFDHWSSKIYSSRS